MQREKNLYHPIWQKYLPVLQLQMKNAAKGEREITMFKREFAIYGNRNLTDYSFTLEIKNGKIIHNAGGTAVSRDLVDIMKDNPVVASLLDENHYKIELGKDYILRINLEQPETLQQPEVVEQEATEETSPSVK